MERKKEPEEELLPETPALPQQECVLDSSENEKERCLGRRVRVGVVRDISECRKANAELAKAKEAAEAANRAKSQFLANMSHDMRTPMNGILGFASALEKTALSGNQREAVEMILLSGNHLLNIINDLLDLAKIEAGKMNLVEEPVALDHFLEEICDFFKPLVAAKNLTLTSERTGDTVSTVMMDPARVRQMLVNLIGNALKFTRAGGVRIRADLRREQNLEDNRRRITFEVADTGIGITSERLETIFDSFNQAPDALSQTYGGTGLGLAITRRLVRMLGGEIHVESAPGEGTTFRLDWIAEVDEGVSKGEDQAPATSPAVPELKGKTILAVDDDPINLKLVLHFLESTKARILTAEDGGEALALMREYLPDLVLMDMRMPFMDGYEATRQAKSDLATASIPIVALTASAMKEDRDRILETGCDDYLAKPITRETLFETIARFLLPARADKPAPSETTPKKVASSETGKRWLHMIAQAVTQEYAPQLDDLLGRNDLAGLRRFGHTMKGLGRQFQLDSLSQWGETFEYSAETLAPDALREHSARFDAIAREIMALCENGQGESAQEGEVAASLDKVSNYS
jgi:two-component system sensor histidine kinase EvgS